MSTSYADKLAPTATWAVDASHTVAEFAVKHMMISTVKGTFENVSGTIVANENDLASAQINVEIGIPSINTRDEKRDAHLRSADFFDAETYPAMIFRSTGIEHVSGERYRVNGDLTIRNITKPVVLDTEFEGTGKDPWGGTRAAFTATTAINRTDFGLNWNVALETGGILVGENVKVTLHVQAVKQ